MNPFYESFQKELGKRLAQIVSAALLVILSVAGISLPRDMHIARIILLSLAGLSLIALSSGLLLRYLSYRKSKNRVEPLKINHQTCEWIKDPPVWKHRTNGLYYCPRCAPNPSILSPDLYCPKCTHSFSKGEVFIADD